MRPKADWRQAYNIRTRVCLRRQATYSVDPRLIQEVGPETRLEAGTTKMQLKHGLNTCDSLTHGQGMQEEAPGIRLGTLQSVGALMAPMPPFSHWQLELNFEVSLLLCNKQPNRSPVMKHIRYRQVRHQWGRFCCSTDTSGAQQWCT